MSRNLDDLIESLEIWQAPDTGFDTPSARDEAMAELLSMGPQVVPVLIERLEALLDEVAKHRARVDAVQSVWTAWYEESDELYDEHGTGVDIKHYRAIPSDSLPQRSVADRNFRDRYALRQGLIQTLHHLGDQRAAHVLTSALSDRACIGTAAVALCDIHADRAAPALLDAITLVDGNSPIVIDPLVAALRRYGVTTEQTRERFDAESSPLGRARLMQMMTRLADDGAGVPPESVIRDSLIFLAFDDRDQVVRSSAIRRLNKIDNRARAWDFELDSASDLLATEPPAEIIRSAIAMAARGEPPGHDRELRSRLRRLRSTASVTRAVEAVLTDMPEPDSEQLDLALRLALGVRISALDDPMQLIRALHRLTSHSALGNRASTVLRRTSWELLFPQLVRADDACSQEARRVFDAVATAEDRAKFADFTASRQRGLHKLVRRFRRS